MGREPWAENTGLFPVGSVVSCAEETMIWTHVTEAQRRVLPRVHVDQDAIMCTSTFVHFSLCLCALLVPLAFLSSYRKPSPWQPCFMPSLPTLSSGLTTLECAHHPPLFN